MYDFEREQWDMEPYIFCDDATTMWSHDYVHSEIESSWSNGNFVIDDQELCWSGENSTAAPQCEPQHSLTDTGAQILRDYENSIGIWDDLPFVFHEQCSASTSQHSRKSSHTPSSAPSSTQNAEDALDDVAHMTEDNTEVKKQRSKPKRTHTQTEVEKRYRRKMRDSLTELERMVPSVRAFRQGGEQVELGGLSPAMNSRKPTVLAKTVEYIRHLERQNHELTTRVERCSCGL